MFGKLFSNKGSKSDGGGKAEPPPPPKPRKFDTTPPEEGEVAIENDLDSAEVTLKIYSSSSVTAFTSAPLTGKTELRVGAGETIKFKPHEVVGIGKFDAAVWFDAPVAGAGADGAPLKMSTSSLCVAGNKYKLRFQPPSSSNPESKVIDRPSCLVLDVVTRRPKKKSKLLAEDIPGLSFGFSASGWLLVYQFGVAECLQVDFSGFLLPKRSVIYHSTKPALFLSDSLRKEVKK